MSPRNEPRAGPPLEEPARHVQHLAKDTEPRSRVMVADELAARRELRSWAAAAAWLNARGYAAAVPDYLVVPLARRGLLVWSAGEAA
jgi:hypothetical protein